MILVPYYKPRGQNEHVFKDTNASTSNRVFGCFGTDPFLFAGYQIAGTERRMNAQFVRPAAIELGLVTEEERFGWHRFRHSLSTWANDTTKDIVQHWDGTRWTLASPSGRKDAALADIVAISPQDVWAVGSLIEHYTCS